MGKANFLRLLNREGIENAECFFSLCPALEECYRAQTGSDKPYQDYYNFPLRAVACPRLIMPQTDFSSYYPDGLKEGTRVDLWGVAHCPGSDSAMHMTRMLHPLSGKISLDTLEKYPFPDFAGADYSQAKADIGVLANNGLASMFVIPDMVWEIAWYLRGMEDLMMDMAVEDEKAQYLLDKVTALACFRAEKYASLGLDILHTGDDVGMQSRMMFSVDFWRKWIKPRMAKVISAAKTAAPRILFSYHSCGFVTPIIDDLIEIGIDILNPVQPECMSFEDIHRQYGNRLSFWGTIGTQTTMPFGSPEDVRDEVVKNLNIAGEKGGLFCTPTHLLEPEVPYGNIEAYIKACAEWKP